MSTFHTIQDVTGDVLTVPVPPEFRGKRVQVLVTPIEDPLSAEFDPRYARYIKQPPPLTEADRQLLAQNPDILKGSVLEYIDPFEPAVPPEDWEANQ